MPIRSMGFRDRNIPMTFMRHTHKLASNTRVGCDPRRVLICHSKEFDLSWYSKQESVQLTLCDSYPSKTESVLSAELRMTLCDLYPSKTESVLSAELRMTLCDLYPSKTESVLSAEFISVTLIVGI